LETNTVKDQLIAGKPVYGLTITANNIEVAAQAATTGFDFLWFEMEHSPITLETIRNIILTTKNSQAMPIARVPVNELWTAKRVLDAGAIGVIFPFVSTSELAKKAVAGCRYPPLGKRGSGASLANFRWSETEKYYDFADKNILVIAIIEEEIALQNIEEIASTPGLDVIFIGTSDLSFSLGLRGEQNHPKLEEAILKVVNTAKKHNKFLGRPLLNPDDSKKFIDQGFLFFQALTEINLITLGAEYYLKPLGKSNSINNKKLKY
jgi:2-keto-3-deoxy-L-rhamnonate aldolase RhmA